MNDDVRKALWNLAAVIAELGPGKSISREELIDRLQPSLPALENGGHYPSDQDIIHNFMFYVIRAGIENSENAEDAVTYSEAARLGDTTEDAIRQAVARGRLNQKLVLRHGRARRGVTLYSLAEYKGWGRDTFMAAAEQVAEWHKS